MFEKAVNEGLIFKCSKCGAERKGSEEKTCEHLYQDYKIKSLKEETKIK